MKLLPFSIVLICQIARADSVGVYPFQDQFGRYGYFGRDGKMVVPPKYAKAAPFSDGLGKVQTADGFAYLKPNGQVAFSLSADSAGDFHSGVAWFERGSKHGYVDHAGKVIIPAEWDNNPDANDGLVVLERSGKKPLVFDFARRAAVPAPPKMPCVVSRVVGEKRIAFQVCEDHLWGLEDLKGQVVVVPTYDAIGEFGSGLARVQMAKKVGFIDPAGTLAIDPSFDEAGNFEFGLARADRGGKKTHIIGTDGKSIFKNRFDDIGKWNEHLIAVKSQGGWGLVDRKGTFVVPAQFKEIWFAAHAIFTESEDGASRAFTPEGKPLPEGVKEALDNGLYRVEVKGNTMADIGEEKSHYLRASGEMFDIALPPTLYGPPPPKDPSKKQALDYFCQVFAARLQLGHEPAMIASWLGEKQTAVPGFTELTTGLDSAAPAAKTKVLRQNATNMGVADFRCPVIEKTLGTPEKTRKR